MIMRSCLFVPVTNARFIAKAAASAADLVILDLEDAIPATEKDAARAALAEAADGLAAAGKKVAVRINRPLSLAVRDIEVAVRPSVRMLVVPKVANAQHLSLLAEMVAELELAAGCADQTEFLPLVETAEAASQLADIAKAPRVSALAFGDEDLATQLGCPVESPLLEKLKGDLVVACKAAEIQPVGLIGSIAQFRDLDGFARNVRSAKRWGLAGTLCIHPAQVAVANEGFAPSEAECIRARHIVDAFESAERAGDAVAKFDGEMIDAPIIERARSLLALAEAGR